MYDCKHGTIHEVSHLTTAKAFNPGSGTIVLPGKVLAILGYSPQGNHVGECLDLSMIEHSVFKFHELPTPKMQGIDL